MKLLLLFSYCALRCFRRFNVDINRNIAVCIHSYTHIHNFTVYRQAALYKHSNQERIVFACCLSPPGSADIREPAEDLVGRDRAQYGAEDSRSAGQRQESQGTDSFLSVCYVRDLKNKAKILFSV